MNFSTALTHEKDLELLKESFFSEIVIAGRDFSRVGTIPYTSLEEISENLKMMGKKRVLAFDLLMTEFDFKKRILLLEILKRDLFDAVRVQDLGAFEFIKENFPQLKIHLSLENGFHNLVSIKEILNYGNKQIEKVILSKELSKEQLLECGKEISQRIEIQVLGRILLFYTPRSLLSHARKRTLQNDEREIRATGNSEESPHHGFELLENDRGTFMYLPKHLSLLEYLDELKESGIADFFIDLDGHFSSEIVEKLDHLIRKFSKELFKELKELWGKQFIRGFYLGNKTDVLFEKLKTSSPLKNEDNYVGEIIEVHKKRLMALRVNNPQMSLRNGDSLLLLTPEGKKLHCQIREMKNAKLEPIEVGDKHGIIYLQSVRGVIPKTIVNKVMDLI